MENRVKIEEHLPLLEEILGEWKADIGKDYPAYKNHVYRVVHFCLSIHQGNREDREKIIIAGCFHDLGIWVNDTFDYLSISIELAKGYLKRKRQEVWSTEIELMINLHHKITRYRDSKYLLVEAFRKADWIDVSKGKRAFGLPKEDIRVVIDKFPNSGFHKKLIQLTKAEFKKNPLKPLPMMKW
ncbi:hypothetical protein BMS3Bbin06_00577 [bacterium BMS3Bbin06]|nr:hypothetical protein BMS3Bbin06_00577 [bacterium BMS3Bbin06]HDL20600.1 HD domain-containing protein [Nitrospirota bacterium]